MSTDEALKLMDSGILFKLLGYPEKWDELLRMNGLAFETALHVRMNNVTLPEEGREAARLQELFGQYRTAIRNAMGSGVPLTVQRNTYFRQPFSSVNGKGMVLCGVDMTLRY